MSDDLVEFLRRSGDDLDHKAADRIKQLERELREEQEESEHYVHKLDEMAQQLTEARAENERRRNQVERRYRSS